MASRESARTSNLMAKLDALRNVPPSVINKPAGTAVVSDGDLLLQLKNFGPATHHLSTLIDICFSLGKTQLKIGNLRYNRWGKVEIFLPEMAQQLKSLRASPEEVEKLAWVVFFPYGEEQEECCKEVAAAFLSDKKPTIAIRLYDFSLVKDNAATEVNAYAPVTKKQIVYGRWQIIRYLPSSPSAESSSPMASIASEIIAASEKPKSAMKTSKTDLSDKEPPKKRAKKSVAINEGKEKEEIDSLPEKFIEGEECVRDE